MPACRFFLLFLLLALCSSLSAQEPTTSTLTATPALDRWQIHFMERVALFREENARLDPNTRYVVFVGDSLTMGYRLKEFYPDLATLDRGIVSDGVIPNRKDAIGRGVLSRMDESILDCQPALMVLTIGTNQIPHDVYTVEELRDGVRDIIEQTRARFPGLPVVLNTIPPVGAGYSKRDIFIPRCKAYNDLLREYAKEEGIPLVDLHRITADEDGFLRAEWTRDNIHMTSDAYVAWTAELDPVIRKALAESSSAP